MRYETLAYWVEDSSGPSFTPVVEVVELFEEVPLDAVEVDVVELALGLAEVDGAAVEVTENDAPLDEIPCPYPWKASPIEPTAAAARTMRPFRPIFSLPIRKPRLQILLASEKFEFISSRIRDR